MVRIGDPGLLFLEGDLDREIAGDAERVLSEGRRAAVAEQVVGVAEVEACGDAGAYSSLAIGVDGLPIIAYQAQIKEVTSSLSKAQLKALRSLYAVDAADMMLQWAALSGALNTVEGDAVERDPETGAPAESAGGQVFFDGQTPGMSLVSETPEISDDNKSITLVYDKPFADWEDAFDTGAPGHATAMKALNISDPQEAKDALGAAGHRYWIYDTGKIVNILLQEGGHQPAGVLGHEAVWLAAGGRADLHHFYADALAVWPDHPVIAHHVGLNNFLELEPSARARRSDRTARRPPQPHLDHDRGAGLPECPPAPPRRSGRSTPWHRTS